MSGPGDRTPKRTRSREPTPSLLAEGQGASPTRVDVVTTFSPGSEEFGTRTKSSAREPGDLDVASPPMLDGRRPQEGDEPQADGQIVEESDKGIVPKKSAKTRVTPVESVEGRPEAKGKSAARDALPAQDGEGALTFLQRIGQRAKEKPEEKWTTLLSHVKVPLLKEAYQRLRMDAGESRA